MLPEKMHKIPRAQYGWTNIKRNLSKKWIVLLELLIRLLFFFFLEYFVFQNGKVCNYINSSTAENSEYGSSCR